MKIDFPYIGYENIQSVEIPDQNLIGFYAPQMAKETNEEEVLANGFEHPIGSKPLRELLEGAAILSDMAQIVDGADCIMVSPGVKADEAKHLGLRYVETVQEALAMAFKRQGKEASIAVLRHGGHLLPIVESESKPFFAHQENRNEFTNES